jgi:hypothetical protein
MKAKYYLVILSLLLLSASTAKAQRDGSGDYMNNDAKLVVNNYYNDPDYYFASRINRFHRSYAAFDYYSPVFTDPYLYDYRPFSLGLNLYGGRGFGLGFSLNFPLLSNYGCCYGDYYGYDPYFGNDYYWGYNPFYYSGWYSPFMFSFNFNLNFGFWNRWRNNYYGWNGYNRYYNHGYNDYRRGHNINNDSHGYSSDRRLSPGSPSRRNSANIAQSSVHNTYSGRGISSGNYSRNTFNNNRPAVRSDRSLNAIETRRNIYAGVNNGRSVNNTNRGINYGRYVRSNPGTVTHSSRTMNVTHAHSFSSRPASSGLVARSSSSHGLSRASGHISGSSKGRSSGRR